MMRRTHALAALTILLGAANALRFGTAPRRRRSHSCASMASETVVVSDATPLDLESCVELTVTGFFGPLGSDYGFNNNLATAYFTLSNEQREDLRPSLADDASITLKAVRGASGMLGLLDSRRVRAQR